MAVDYWHHISNRDMEVATFRKPEALIFKEMQSSKVSAWVCSACGYIEYYADIPSKLRRPNS
jgi:predicted nucleic-acid-binding Zn-ribbon protein